MSHDNVELARSISDPWNRGDFGSVEWAHPDIEWHITDGPAPGRWTGVAGMAEGWREFLSAWEKWHSEGDGFREVDDDRVLALFRFSARGKASGLDTGELGTKSALLFHFVDGKVKTLVLYWDRERAFAELGLPE